MTPPDGPSLSERYQEATKYTPRSVQEHTALDFDTQPPTFKDWHQARRISLAGGPDEPVAPSPGSLDAERLGRLLFHTYGVTLVREYPSMTMRFRAAPSAGGLYPAELYVAVRDVEDIPDGLYAYDAREHALVVCWEGDFWPDLGIHALGHPAIARARAVLIATAVWERSTWRYQDRGYRRVLLDTGHMIGNAVLAGAPDGLGIVPLPYFDDDGVSGLLLLDDTKEGPLLLAAVVDAEDQSAWAEPRPFRSTTPAAPEEPATGEWSSSLQRAGKLAANAVAAVAPEVHASEDEAPALDGAIPLDAEPLAEGPAVHAAIRRRRSTRRFLPAARISGEALGRILAHAYPQGSAGPAAALLPEGLATYVVLTGVEGIPNGVYRYDAAAHELLPIRFGDATQVLHKICLWQELGRDCVVAVIHTIDLPAAIVTHGERVYRTAHLDAGLIGQRLNMAALRLGYGASGIGGFFDEFLNELLMLPPQHAMLYVTTIGVPY